LTYIFHKSLSQGIFQEQLKNVIVNPLFVKGDKSSQLANNRLISILTGFSKLLEILTLRRINQHFQLHHVQVPKQYGYQKGLSTDNASYKLNNFIFKSKNKKIYVSGNFCLDEGV
jgi:hypothetical protein